MAGESSETGTPETGAPLRQRVAVAVTQELVHITFPAGLADGIAVRELYEVSVPSFGQHHVRMVVDLTGTRYVPSGMMGMLITIKKKVASAGGQMHVVIPDPLVRDSFLAMGLNRILSLHALVEEATANFKD